MASAVAMVSLRRLGTEPPEVIVSHFSFVATIVTSVAVAVGSVGGTLRVPHGWFEFAIVLAVGATATLGQLIMTRAYALDRAARVGGVGWVQVLLALLIDGVLRRQWPHGKALFGIALLVFAGILLYLSAREADATAVAPTSADPKPT